MNTIGHFSQRVAQGGCIESKKPQLELIQHTMGVEWQIGCLKCKRQIWLGSQKPFKWNGFQIGDENVKRFLSLHSACNGQINGNLLLVNDGTTKIPWEDELKSREWQEDILSRTFCFDSWNNEAMVCAHCSKTLDAEEEDRLTKGNLKKSQFLWFCDESCFADYVGYQRNDRDRSIYDSTNDVVKTSTANFLEVRCQNCRTYVIIDHQQDAQNTIRDFEYPADFLSEHVGHQHLLKVNLEKNGSLGEDPESDGDWKEYEN